MSERRDPIGDLESFGTEGTAMSPLAPSEVRRRGDRMRRRRNAFVAVGAAAAVAAITTTGAVLGNVGGPADRGHELDPATQSPTPTTTPSASPALTEIPDDFPIAANLTVTDRGTDARVADDLDYCGDRPLAGVTIVDAVSAEMAGGETSVRRTLLLFGSDRAAADAERALLDSATACPTQVSEGPTDVVHQVLPASADWPGRTIRTSYGPTDTSFAQVNRAGPSLLLSTFYWMGQPDDGLAESRASLVPLITALDRFGPVVQPTSDATDSPSGGTTVPSGFPLDLEMEADGGDFSKSGPSPDADGIVELELCGRSVWPTSPYDRLAANISGPEYADDREVVTFPDAAAAVEVLEAVRSAAAGCPTDENRVWTVMDEDTGYDTVSLGLSYSDGLGSHVFEWTRVGSGVLLITRYGEGSIDSLPDQAAEVTAITGQITPAMCAFTQAGCGGSTPSAETTTSGPTG